jgi:hypothetical protein
MVGTATHDGRPIQRTQSRRSRLLGSRDNGSGHGYRNDWTYNPNLKDHMHALGVIAANYNELVPCHSDYDSLEVAG